MGGWKINTYDYVSTIREIATPTMRILLLSNAITVHGHYTTTAQETFIVTRQNDSNNKVFIDGSPLTNTPQYAMIQPRMHNNNNNYQQYDKVVCWNGEAMCISGRQEASRVEYKSSCTTKPTQQIIIWSIVPHAITTPALVRVDIVERRESKGDKR